MIICYTNANGAINLRWRDKQGNRQEEMITDFRPYFFVHEEDNEPQAYETSVVVNNRRVKLIYPFSYEGGEFFNLQNAKLKKVLGFKPGDIKDMKKFFGKTYEADVAIHHRYAIDHIDEIKEYELRKWYWDMEWLPDDHEHEGAITCIVVYDNYSGLYYQWAWFPDAPSHLHWKQSDKIAVFSNEKDMLEDFMSKLQKQDPDMLIAWFGLKFDLPKLIQRLWHHGIDPRKLSPYNDVKHCDRNGPSKRVETYSPIEQPIRGRICLNLDLAFERQWNDSQRGTLPSMALDYIAELVFGEHKLVSEKFPDKNEFFRRGWLEDTETYLDYALKDVELIRRIDETNFCSEAILSLQKLLMAPFDACFYASHMGGMYFMKNAKWKAPTGNKSEIREKYDGAFVFNPQEEKTNGRYTNVAAFDFAGLYPSMIISRNISWETKSPQPTDFAVNLKTPRTLEKSDETRMVYYRTDELGLLPKAVLNLKNLRDSYKKKMRESETKEEEIKWHNNQMAVKRLMASFYGIVAYQGFGWTDVLLAASITASAREAIREVAFKVRELE